MRRITGALLWPPQSNKVSRSRRFQHHSLTSTAIARPVCHRICCKRNAISSAHTLTSASTNRASFTPNGWSPIKNRRKKKPNRRNQRRVTPANRPFFCRGDVRHSGSESAAVWIVRREASPKVVRLAPDQLVVGERSDFARFD